MSQPENERKPDNDDTAELVVERHLLRLWVYIGLIIGLVVVIVLSWWLPVRESAGWLVAYVSRFGVWAALVYVLLCLPALVLGLPLSLVLIVTGVLFGLWPGLAIGYGLVVGAAVSGYWLTRLGGLHHWRECTRKGRWQRIREEMADQDFTFVALFRMMPTLPYGATNVLLAILRIDFVPFLLGTVLGITPGIFVHVYIGWVGGISLTSEQPLSELPPSILILLALNVCALFALSGVMWYRFRKALTGPGTRSES